MTAFETRTLPAAEWDKLAATDFPSICAYVGPEDLDVIVVEHDGLVVGCWGLMPMLHLEGLWIHPDHRGRAAVARRLLRATWAEVRAREPRWVMTAAVEPAIRQLLVRQMNAIHVPGDVYAIPLYGEKKCQSLL